jgi:hypothetical protein
MSSPRLLPWLPAILVATTGALLLSPDIVQGYSTLGGSLGLAQRDVRIYNTFADTTANDNTTIHSQFPGYDGAELAIWKAAVEWGSSAHGDGSGDSKQSTLGSGGANFDPSWQGNATQVGNTNSNIHSPIAGSSGGVLAYAETPISNGWRIRYYEGWGWDDGPGSVSGWDLQSVATHEYGHALGLGHSSVSGTTMWPSIGGGTTSQRSIHSDDIAGLQAIYGVKAASKPLVTGISVSAGQIAILGSNFSATGNEVWFTQSASGGNGDPIKVTSVASLNGGTRIEIGAWPSFIPGNAGPGDLLVRSDGAAHANLSNAFPIDIIPPGGGCSGGVPDVSAVFPPLIQALTTEVSEVTLLGCNFLGTSSITVDGITMSGFPPLFSVLSDTELRFNMPQANNLGPVDIFLTNATGTSVAAQIQVQAPSPANVAFRTPYLFSGLGIDIYYGGQPGDLMFIVGSPSLGVSDLPGLFTADIGANFSSLFLLVTPVVPAAGWGNVVIPLPQLPTGFQINFQGLVLEVANPVLPLVSTEVQSRIVLF